MAYGVLALTLLIWSFSFYGARVVMGALTVPEALAARFVPVLIGCLLLLALRRPNLRALTRGDWLRLAAMGALSVPLYNLFFFAAMRRVPSGTAALIIALNPAFTALLASFFLGETFGARRLLGLVSGLAGVFVILQAGGQLATPGEVRDALLLVLAPLCWAGYTVIGRAWQPPISRFDATLLLLTLGSAPMIIGLRGGLPGRLAAQPAVLAWALYLGLFCTLFGFAAWLWALGRLPAGKVAAFVFLNPPLAALWAAWLEGLRPDGTWLLGAALVLVGMALILFGRK